MCKITGTLQTLEGGKNKAKQEKIKELLQIGETMKTWKLSTMWDSGFFLVLKDMRVKLVKPEV